MKRIHYTSAIILTLFIVLHLLNHLYGLLGVASHIAFMDTARIFYRNAIAETLLVGAVLVQIVSGIKLFLVRRKTARGIFEKLQLWSGLYLAMFFVFHLGAVFTGRYILHLDTNIYFGVAGLNTFPFNLFFVPYYAFAIVSFFAHIASIHNVKAKNNIFSLQPEQQAYAILFTGIAITVVVLYALTDGFSGIAIPEDYHIMLGK